MSNQRGEFLGIASLEGFLSPAEIRAILRPIDHLKRRLQRSHGRAAITAGTKDTSVHRLDSFGLTAKRAARVFAPRGRIEISLGDDLPAVRARLDDAFFRRIEDIRRTHPRATWPRGWTYVEYGPGQDCTTHADGTFGGTQVAACSIRLDDRAVGGEFYVETSGSPALWMDGAASAELLTAGLYDNRWLRALPKTRWLAMPATGTAIVWGAQLLHGTQPVVRGTARKIIAWIEAG